jgi:hypothetical protein
MNRPGRLVLFFQFQFSPYLPPSNTSPPEAGESVSLQSWMLPVDLAARPTVRCDGLSAVHSRWQSSSGAMPVGSPTSPMVSGEEVRLA